MIHGKQVAYFLWVFFMVTSTLVAQDFYPSQRTWEKTRIQYQKIKWNFISNQNFEVYYYGKNEALARVTIQQIDAEFSRLTRTLSYSPYQKTKIFLYPSAADLSQSNAGISFINPMDAKDEDLSKFRIEIAFDQNLFHFKRALIHAVAEVYVRDILFGGSIRDALQSSLLLSLPPWFSTGIASYVANGDMPEVNQFMYQVVSTNKVRKPNLAQGKEAEFIGHSIWAYIAKTYGDQAVGNILNLTRIIRNEQSSIASTVRVPFSKFLKAWFDFYVSESKQYEVNTSPISGFKNIASSLADSGHQLGSFAVSPDGQWLAYFLEDTGQFNLYVVETKTGKSQAVFQTGLKDPLRSDVAKSPFISWSKSNGLFVVYANEGKTWLNQYSGLSKSKRSLRLDSKRNLGDWVFLAAEVNASAQRMLVRTLRNGQVDVGIFDLRRNKLTPVTQDPQDDLEAHWFGSEGDVIYVAAVKQNQEVLNVWQASNPSEVKTLLTHQGHIHDVRPLADSLIVFLHDYANGVELVSFNTKDSLVYQNRSKTGAWSHVAWVGDQIFVQQKSILTTQLDRIAAAELIKAPSYRWYPILADSLQALDASRKVLSDSLSAKEQKTLDVKRSRLERQQVLRLRKEPTKLVGPFPYQNSFVVNGSEGNFRIDPLRGLGYSMDMRMNDLLENHLIKVGGLVTSNLQNLDLWGEYAYLANKLDWKVRYDRKVLDQETESLSQKIRYNRIEITGIYPLNLVSNVHFSGMFTSNRAFDQYVLTTPESLSTFIGGRLAYNFDNTVHWAENLRTGFRMHASVESQVGLINNGFNRIKLDVRKYIKLSNSFLLAARFSGSHAFGLSPVQTMLGGMDNWIFIDREQQRKANPIGTAGIANRDVFMADFATSLRGFKINKLSGNSHLLMNVELRVPVASLLNSTGNKSQFINSFQFIGFSDIGSAWTGANPFSRANGFNTNVLGGNTNPFQATVSDFRNPFLISYGFGARAKVFGYFIKLDYAYGIENDEIRSPITYLTLGNDF